MIRCTNSYFSQTSPQKFFSKNYNKSSLCKNQQDYQISDQQISEKLSLILISIREQSSNMLKCFISKQQKLNSIINDKNETIKKLIKNNQNLTSSLNLYRKKYGNQFFQISEIQGVNSVLQQNQQTQSQSQLLFQSCDYFIQVHQVKKATSEISTTYKSKKSYSQKISQYQDQLQNKKGRNQEKQYEQECINQLSLSTNSNFFKKSYKIYDGDSEHFPNHYNSNLHLKPAQYNNSIKMPFLNNQFETISKQQQDIKRINQIQCLEKNQQEIIQYQNIDSRIENQREFKNEYSDDFVQNMKEILQKKYECQNQPHKNIKVFQSINNTIQNPAINSNQFYELQLSDLNNSYAKQMHKTYHDFKNMKQSNNNGPLSSKLYEKKLRKLFSPFPQNILSKKLQLPSFQNKQNLQLQPRESINLKTLQQIFSTYKSEIKSPERIKWKNKLGLQ